MTDFEQRLQDAIARGQQRGERTAQRKQQQALNDEELKRLHSKHRLLLSEHIENCIQKLPQYFPGFRFETLFGDRGWGAACSRDDILLVGGKRDNLFTRLELTVRPFSSYHVVDLAAKGTVRNKELFTRNHFVKIEEVEEAEFLELIDRWVLEFAELYAAQK
jgi:hypothetical protein